MNYEKFERDFIYRTQQVVEQYDLHVMNKVSSDNQFEVTLLINCLLGLLIVPKDYFYRHLPIEPLHNYHAWGVSEATVRKWGSYPSKMDPSEHGSLKEFVRRLRNCIAHPRSNIKVKGKSEITEIEFRDRYGFEAALPIHDLKKFVLELAKSLDPESKSKGTIHG